MQRTHGKKDPAQLISPEEITAIMQRAGTAEDIYRAAAIAAAYRKCNNTEAAQYPQYDFLCLLSTVYQAGRIQGIREQRAQKNGKQA